jgi:hypothetical protein
MARLCFTLAQLMAIVLFIGFGFAALRSASVLWASAIFTLTVAILLVAVLGAIARRGRARMTWTGFALFGGIYLGTTFEPWADVNGVRAPPYATRWPLDYWDAKVWSGGGWIDTAPTGEMLFPRFSPFLTQPDSFQARRSGHCLAAILLGLVGAFSGRLLAPRDEQPNP